MPEPVTRSYVALAPMRRDRAGWNQAMIEIEPLGAVLQIDVAGVAKLDPGFIAALALADQERLRHGGGVRLIKVDEDIRTIARMAGVDRLLTTSSGAIPPDFSCVLACDNNEVVIMLQLQALQNQRLVSQQAHVWIKRLAAEKVVVDLGELSHITSVLVAWILQLSQVAKPIPLTLRNVSRQVQIQLTQLRLHHLLTVTG